TAAGIPTWSPTVVLICRSTAYVWQSGRDAQFSADCGQVSQKLYNRRAIPIGILASEVFPIGWTSMKQFAILCNPVRAGHLAMHPSNAVARRGTTPQVSASSHTITRLIRPSHGTQNETSLRF
ncbi:hypothetical protein KCU92_g3417, partial [Aureobasidium melanogenum]